MKDGSMTAQQSTLRSALAELVTLRDGALCVPPDYWPAYRERLDAAWSAARAALQQVPEQPPVQTTDGFGNKGLYWSNPAPNAAAPAPVGLSDVLDARRLLAEIAALKRYDPNRPKGYARSSITLNVPATLLKRIDDALSVEQQDQPQTSGD